VVSCRRWSLPSLPSLSPVRRRLREQSAAPLQPDTELDTTIVTAIYLVVRAFAGLAAYVVGTMWYPGKLRNL
jgi:hypothetical protein